jgi:hypothetical protein
MKMSDIFASLKTELLALLSKLLDLNAIVENRAGHIHDTLCSLTSESKASTKAMFDYHGEMRQRIDESYAAYRIALDAKAQLLSGLMAQSIPLLTAARMPNCNIRELTVNIQQLLAEIGKELEPIPVPRLADDFVPSDSEASFVVPKFRDEITAARNREGTQFLYTGSQRIYGNKWRLKIYPNGNMDATNTHVSLFVELKAGPMQDAMYYFKVMIMGWDKPAVRQYQRAFSMGVCWGWNKIVLIERVLSGEFLDRQGQLVIRVSIRPQSYADATRAMQFALRQKKEKYKKLKLARSVSPQVI